MNVVVKQIYFCFIVISLVTGCEITELLWLHDYLKISKIICWITFFFFFNIVKK
jgi:hypothetical protein